MRTPVFGKLAQLLLSRLFLHAEQLADLDLDGEVAGRPDVRAAFGEQKINFRRPAADALDPRQMSDGILIVLGQAVEVELAREYQSGKAAGITGFLPRQAGGAQ